MFTTELSMYLQIVSLMPYNKWLCLSTFTTELSMYLQIVSVMSYDENKG